jgi:hypothetical protein
MVSPEVLRQFKERGVQVIEPDRGRRMVGQEIEEGRKDTPEVVIGGGPWETLPEQPAKPASTTYPLLAGLSLTPGLGGTVEVVRVLDPEKDCYLKDHCLDGRPVFPLAMAMELVAEVVSQGWPDWVIASLLEMQVLKGIILDNGPKPVRIAAHSRAQQSQERLEIMVDVEIGDVEPGKQRYYRATVLLADRLPDAPPCRPVPFVIPQTFSVSVEEAYQQFLFHGPAFRTIVQINEIAEEGMVATLQPSVPQACLSGRPPGNWVLDPIVIDGGFQMAILWERAYKDMTPLPARFRAYHRYGTLKGGPIRCILQVNPASSDHTLRTNLSFISPDGRLVGLMEDMEFACSRALNRLAGAGSSSVRDER